MFDPARLKIARQRLSFTRTLLAEKSEISLRSLTSYENAELQPSAETLEKLAVTLRVRSGFFEKEALDPIAIESVSFRKLSKTSAIKRDAVLASARLALCLAEVIESRFQLPEPQIPSFDKFSPEQSAEMLRVDWSLGSRPISNIIHLLESKGVRILALSAEHSAIDAFSFFRDGIPFIFLNTTKSGERQRFDAAHELGHLVLHSEKDMGPSDSKSREAEANLFAANLLMPSEGVLSQSMSEAAIDRILAARNYWRVSAMAMTHRLHELHLLGDWNYRMTCAILSERGYRSKEPDGIIPETSQLLRKVFFKSTSKISLRESADILALHPVELRGFLNGLMPVVI